MTARGYRLGSNLENLMTQTVTADVKNINVFVFQFDKQIVQHRSRCNLTAGTISYFILSYFGFRRLHFAIITYRLWIDKYNNRSKRLLASTRLYCDQRLGFGKPSDLCSRTINKIKIKKKNKTPFMIRVRLAAQLEAHTRFWRFSNVSTREGLKTLERERLWNLIPRRAQHYARGVHKCARAYINYIHIIRTRDGRPYHSCETYIHITARPSAPNDV